MMRLLIINCTFFSGLSDGYNLSTLVLEPIHKSKKNINENNENENKNSKENSNENNKNSNENNKNSNENSNENCNVDSLEFYLKLIYLWMSNCNDALILTKKSKFLEKITNLNNLLKKLFFNEKTSEKIKEIIL